MSVKFNPLTGTFDLINPISTLVTGPDSATDKAIARYNSTTGKLLQDSGLTIDDSNNMFGLTRTEYTTSLGPPTFDTQSGGTKITLYPQLTTNAVDYAIGMDGSTVWMSLPQFDPSMFWKLYAGETEIMSIGGEGDIITMGNVDAGDGFKVNGVTGATGSFTTVDGKTVTVVKGIITSIV